MQNLITFLNLYVVQKYENRIQNDKILKNKFHSFYKKLSESKEYLTDNIYDLLDLFELENNYDIEYSINQLKGRKKSQNINMKIDSKLKLPDNNIFDILEWPPIEIARQLSLISHHLFSKIDFIELLNTNWTKKDKQTLSPNVIKVIDRFNKFTLWIIEEVLSYDKKRMRAGAIERLIQIAEECRILNNFNDCISIVTALNNHILKGLDKTIKLLNKQSLETFNKLEELCSYEKNYNRLRIQQKTTKNNASVPYLGLLLKDLAYIEEGPKYVKDNDMVNYDKINLVGTMITEFLSYNTQAYLFRVIPQLLILSDMRPRPEEELETLAFEIEPVFSLNKSKNKKKRVTNTDSKYFLLIPNYNDTVSKANDLSIFEDHY